MPDTSPPPSPNRSNRAWRLLVILAAAAILIGHAYFNPPQPKPDAPQRERVGQASVGRNRDPD